MVSDVFTPIQGYSLGIAFDTSLVTDISLRDWRDVFGFPPRFGSRSSVVCQPAEGTVPPTCPGSPDGVSGGAVYFDRDGPYPLDISGTTPVVILQFTVPALATFSTMEFTLTDTIGTPPVENIVVHTGNGRKITSQQNGTLTISTGAP